MRLLKLWLPVIVWAIVILWASDDTFSSSQSHGWLSWLLGRDVTWGLNVAIRKLGHIISYGLLGALTWRADRRLAVVLAIALAVATTDEWRQSLTLTRTGTPWDVLLDLAGSWLGMFAARKVTAG
ncbi:MAG: VanZ family protein [Thermoanaerobaculia bacterium]